MEATSSIRYPLKISGVGRYLPKRTVSSRELEEKCGLPEGWCERKQGVRERRWIEDETVSFLCSQAAKEAVADAGMELSDIDLIFNASQSFDQAVPEGGSQIQRELGLGDSGVACMSVNSGCLSFLVALDMSASLLSVGRFRNILVVSSIINSSKLDFNNPNVCTMMGDGAAAIVVTQTPPEEKNGVHAVRMETYSEGIDVSRLAGSRTRSTLFSTDVAGEDFLFDFDPQSMQRTGMKYNQRFMKKLWPVLNIDSIKLVIPNQASRFVLDYMKLVFPADKIVGIIDRFGNCGAVGYPLALYEAVKEKRMRRGDMVLLTGMGAGFSIIGIVLTY